MKQLALVLLVLIATLAVAQSEQEVEYGVLQLGPTNYFWSTDSGGSYFYDPADLIRSMTNGTFDVSDLPDPIGDRFGRTPESFFLNHLASWGWRLVAAVPYPEGGVQYTFERACDFEPSGCYE
jgi:hypothetical protein